MVKYSTSGLGLQIQLTLRPIESFEMHFVFLKIVSFLLPSMVSQKLGWRLMSGSGLDAPEFRLQAAAGAIYQSEIFPKLFPITQNLTTAFQLAF